MDSVSPHLQWRGNRASNRAELTEVIDAMMALESGLLSMSNENLKSKIMLEAAHKSTHTRLVHQLASRNVLLYHKELLRLVGEADNSIAQERKAFQSSIEKRTGSIMRSWENLRGLKNTGKLNKCREIWMRMAKCERQAWLRQHFPKLPEHAHSYIYAWLRRSKLRPNSNLFVYRLLNIDTLSRDDVLPDLLEIRATLHPRHQLDIDGRAIYLGICCGCLPSLKVSGLLRPPLQQTDDKYDVVWDENAGRVSLIDMVPGHGLHMLGAQDMVYSWLATCPQDLIRTSMLDSSDKSSENQGTHTSPLPLLTRSILSEYHEIYNCIDLAYLDSLLTGALDESLFDLAQSRKYPDVWHKSLKGTPWTAACSTLFAQVDIFHTLSSALRCIRQREGNRMILKGRGSSFKLLTAFYHLLESMVEEVLCQLSRGHWPPDRCGSPLLSSLFKLLQDNDPMFQIMPVVDVMTVIDIETKKLESSARMPRRVVQTLNDLSVIGACKREAEKHYKFARDIASYAELLTDLEKETQISTRPWKSLFEAGLNALDGDVAHKLDTHIRNQAIDLQLRHYNFWNIIDGALGSIADGTTQAAVNKILNMTRADAPALLAAAQASNFERFVTSQEPPTRTQLKRSKGHNLRPGPQQVPPLLYQTSEIATLPVVELRNQKEFWNALLAQSSENFIANKDTALLFSTNHTLKPVFLIQWRDGNG
ncbi:hypothetical protein NQ176_g3992 [Zarea fungicola]|uniref:Uncharacterized protein n=1 Tax=Zarea fungicola TaxID=93591 RepID=A0ACC1NFL9_9HYPO|nr:hypothetical protein NQ176_g3992 [Lecanicillium fungicola]